MKTNIIRKIVAIFSILEKESILFVLYTKIPKLNEKENIDIVAKML